MSYHKTYDYYHFYSYIYNHRSFFSDNANVPFPFGEGCTLPCNWNIALQLLL